MLRLTFHRAGNSGDKQKPNCTLPAVALTGVFMAALLMEGLKTPQLAVYASALPGAFLDTVRGTLDLVIGFSLALMLACAALAAILLSARLLAILRRLVA